MHKITSADKSLRTSYEQLKGNLKEEDTDAVRRKRMIYRAKQRGWLEADILLGSWAKEFVPSLTASELDEFDEILREETIDAYNYISGKDELPDHLKSNSVMQKIQEFAIKSNLTEPASYAALKEKSNLI